MFACVTRAKCGVLYTQAGGPEGILILIMLAASSFLITSRCCVPNSCGMFDQRWLLCFRGGTLAVTRASSTSIVGGSSVGSAFLMPFTNSSTSFATCCLGSVITFPCSVGSCVFFARTSSHLSSSTSPTGLSVIANKFCPFNLMQCS